MEQVVAERQRLKAWLGRHPRLVFVALVALASLRIVSTYTVFSHTSDEPAHLATGMEWLDRGRFRYEPLHPPLARVATALGPFLDGRSSQGKPDMWQEGVAILGQGPAYERNLSLARLGILPFFWIACLVVYAWGRRYFNEAVAGLAVFIFSLLPPVLAHAGLATTDMALTAMLGAAFLSGAIWCERPGVRSSLRLGLTTGLAVLSKFSSLAFLPVTALAAGAGYLLLERPRPAELAAQLRQRLFWLVPAALLGLLVIWAGYRFSVGTLSFGSLHLPVPFPELFMGVKQLAHYQQRGAPGYLLGQFSTQGWWYYYFVALGVKTPLSVLILAGFGLVLGARAPSGRGWWLALAFCSGILLFCMLSHINLGIRHVLPVYIGLSLLAAAGFCRLLELGRQWRAAHWIAAGLLLELGASSALAHPDYLAYFNPLAGRHPEQVLVDSDLDWGQDMKRLAQRLRQLGATQLSFTPCTTIDPAAIGLPPPTPNDFMYPSPGWNAIRLTQYEMLTAQLHVEHPEAHLWPEYTPPLERIGKGILLFRFPDSMPPRPAKLPTAHVYCY